MKKVGPRSVVAKPSGRDARPARKNATNLIELAHERLEELIVDCELRPGSYLTIQDIQDISGLSRTPVYQAVTRLAADTLIIIRPRHGLQIAPIDLERERLLLRLRRDLERFVAQLAAERASASHRAQMVHLARQLRDLRGVMPIMDFNAFDRRIDRLILAAAGELFLENALRPLHTIFRRIGWIYHSRISDSADIGATIDAHLAVLDSIVNRDVARAVSASDALIDFVDEMFSFIELNVDPALLDCTFEPVVPSRPASRRR